jgi:hypothetical protein
LTGEGRTSDLAGQRQQHERPGQPAEQGTRVVGGVEVGEHRSGRAGVDPARLIDNATGLQQRHQQRHLGAHEDADHRRRPDQHRGALPVEREADVQRHRAEPADDAEQDLDGDEHRRRMAQERLDQQRSHAQRRDEPGDDQRRLGDPATCETDRERQQDELVDQPARRADRHRGEQQRTGPPQRRHSVTTARRRSRRRWRRG